MKSFEYFWFLERLNGEKQIDASLNAIESRRLRRERLEKAKQDKLQKICFVVIMLAYAVILSLSILRVTAEAANTAEMKRAATAEEAEDITTVTSFAPPLEDLATETEENALIEAALYESGYFRKDIPLDGDTQAYLRSACEESGIPYELALSVIWKETGFQNKCGDGGESVGYMQVQERWHRERMERLGVTDLSEPYANFRVGCDYLAELLEAYPLEYALTAYNSGKPGESEYAKAVMSYMEGL